MQRTGQGPTAATSRHTELANNYESGHCSAGGHERCRGDFRSAVCSCTCHTGPPPPLQPTVATVHCFFGCPAVVASTDPQDAQAAMEAHYFSTHRADIKQALWGVA